MTTWSSRAAATALALLGLAGCEEGFGTTSNAALSQAKMAFGAVTLVPPRGFCIDRNSLKQQFALIARCDALGAPSAAADAPIGVITVSFSAAQAEGSLPTPEDTAAALDLSNISARRETDNAILFRAQGAAPVEGLSPRHWRATTRVGGHIMGVALYGPSDGRAVSGEGRAILTELIDGTSAGS